MVLMKQSSCCGVCLAYFVFMQSSFIQSAISGRREIITDFKALLATFPEEMEMMQSQLSKFKEDAVDIHSLRAEVQSLTSILNGKVGILKGIIGCYYSAA